MNKEFKVGDIVIFIDKSMSEMWEEEYGVSLYNKLAKVINRSIYNEYTYEFKNDIKSAHDGDGLGKKGYCWYGTHTSFKSISSLKLKKLIKHGV